ncbi:MAG: MFS transporter [Lentisphaeria bacterium]|nr:MFS transporter [Lentisphaeria bacterium]
MNGENAGGKPGKIWSVGTLTYTTGTLIALFAWLLWGDFAWAMKDRAIGPAATLLISKLDVSETLYSLIIISYPNFTNIFLCPIISYISDRHRGRLGRRIPFLLFTTPFIVIGAIGLGFSPRLGGMLCDALGGSLSLNACKLIAFAVFCASLDFGQTQAGALASALYNDVVPREVLGRFFALFRAISLFAGMLFNWYLMKPVETHYEIIFLGVGLLYGIGLLCMCLKVKEGQYPPPPELPKNVDGSELSSVQRIVKPFVAYFRQSFSVPYYRWVIAALVFGGLSAVPYNMFSIRYAQSVGMDMGDYGKICAITYLISFCVSYPLGWLADRFHPLRMSILALCVYLLTMIFGGCFTNNHFTFGLFLLLHNIFSGCYFTLSASLVAKLFPRSLFAQFNSANAMILALANTCLAMVFGAIIDALGGNYICVFWFGALMTLISVLTMLWVFRDFLRLGGDAAYTAPDPGD